MSGPLSGSVEPRIFTPPLRELAPETSWGFDIIWFAAEILGEELSQWQSWFVIHAFELLSKEEVQKIYPHHPKVWGLDIPRFKTVVLLVARQNGKTHLSKVIIKWALFRKRMRRVLGSAQTKNDAKDLWLEILEECRSHPKVSRKLGKVTEANGSEALRSKYRGSYRIAAPNGSDARGKTNNLLYIDELREHHTEGGFAALSSTTLSPVGAMNLCTSNAGDERSVVLRDLRGKAIKSIDSGDTSNSTVGLFEWSAEPDLLVDDRRGWVQANPDLGSPRMTERDILAQFDAQSENAFRTENLCQWVQDLQSDDFIPLVPFDRWGSFSVTEPVLVGERVLVVEVSMDGEKISMVSGGQSTRGVHLEVSPHSGEFQVDSALSAISSFVDANDPAAVIFDPTTPASVLEPGLRALGIDPSKITYRELSDAFRDFDIATREGRVTNDGNSVWLDALKQALKRESSDGKYVTVERFSGDVSVLVAGTIAVWGVSKFSPKLPKTALKVETKIIENAVTLTVPSSRLATSGGRRIGDWG